MNPVNKRRILGEVLLVWLATLIVIRAVVMLSEVLPYGEILIAAVPLLFMYVPVAVCRFREVDPDAYRLAIPAIGDRETWLAALKLNGIIIGLIAVPFVLAYHYYQSLVFGITNQWAWPPLLNGVLLVLYHLFFVAIPEELFYRGYVQTRLREAYGGRWRIFGGLVGPAWLITCVIFAAGHSIVQFQWWHFAIFFPSLVFGWMRAYTDDVAASALFHAWCNITVSFLDHIYGIIQPENL